jgi:hypothetical protein
MEFEVVTSQNTVYHCKLLLSFISCMYSCATIIVPGSNLQIEPLSKVPLNLILESQQVPKHNPYSDHKEPLFPHTDIQKRKEADKATDCINANMLWWFPTT